MTIIFDNYPAAIPFPDDNGWAYATNQWLSNLLGIYLLEPQQFDYILIYLNDTMTIEELQTKYIESLIES